MTVIDRRATPLTATFGDLLIGEVFQDKDGDICIKTDIGAYMFWWSLRAEWIPKYDLGEDDPVARLKASIIVESED